MAHTDQIAARLPELYRDGGNLSRLLAVAGNQFHMLDEAATDVRRAHFFQLCTSLEEAAKLAAVLDIAPEPWQQLTEYRAWVDGLRSARLKAGSVTCEGIRIFTRLYLEGFQRGNQVDLAPSVTEFASTPNDETVALVENPPVYRLATGPTANSLLPLEQFKLENRGLDPAPLALVVTALGETGPEFAPMIANLTTGEALVYLGAIPPGQRLWLLPVADGDTLVQRALLEGVDVSDKLKRIADIVPGRAESAIAATGPVTALRLARGDNHLWFLPLAHFDVPGLDRALLALADLSLKQGLWDETAFDHALFVQTAAARLQLAWREAKPAAFELQVPAGRMRSRPGQLEAALSARDNLETALNLALQRLSAAGVEARAGLRPRRERQAMADRLAAVIPATHRDAGSVGADRLPDLGGRFGVTEFNESKFD